MKLSTGITAFFLLSCVAAFLVPLLRAPLREQLNWRWQRVSAAHFPVGLLGLLLVFGVATVLRLMTPMAALAGVGSFLLYGLLYGSGLSSILRGIVLLLGAFSFFTPEASALGDAAATQPLMTSLFSLAAGRLLASPGPSYAGDKPERSDSQPAVLAELTQERADWQDFALPAIWMIGVYWLGLTVTEPLLSLQTGLLAILLGVALLVRTLLALPVLSENQTGLRLVFSVVIAALGGWLAVQIFLVKPALLQWVWLLAGSVLLGNLLSLTGQQTPSLTNRLITLVLIGLGTLVASRLYGTTGWLVLATGLLAIPRLRNGVALGALFLLGRSLLQGFIFQYNPNVTGINITHPYAGAALYAGLTLALLLPGWLNGGREITEATADVEQTTVPSAWPVSLIVGAAMLSGLANYFLHAEATGSLLVALLVGAVGMGVLGFKDIRSMAVYSPAPLLWAQLATAGALLFSDLLTAGNEAEKMQKIEVLGAALLVSVVLFWWTQRGGSGRKPVEVV